MRGNGLFGVPGIAHRGNSLTDFLEERRAAMSNEVRNWNPEEFLQLADEDIVAYLVDRYRVECPALDRGRMYQLGVQDAQLEVASQYFPDRGPVKVSGSRMTVAVPFEGTTEVFARRPSTRQMVDIRGKVKGNEILLKYEWRGSDTEAVLGSIESDVGRIEQHLAWAATDIGPYNERLPADALAAVQSRRQKILADRQLESGLGIPVRKRDAPPPITPQVSRKRVSIARPSASGAFEPEPALSEAIYEEVIQIILNMGNALERTPATSSALSEEAIRDLILVQLNGTFQGAAGGELFNAEGKTDILVRINDRNVFIGECKIWRGRKSFDAAIDQLLGYLVWRDTKAAIVLFIKQTDVSQVIEKADEATRQHPKFKRAMSNKDGDRRRDYVFASKDDDNREIRVAFLPMPIRQASAT